MRETRYLVEIKTAEKPLKLESGVLESLKGIVGAKQINRMKKEYVLCPMKDGEVPFLYCFNCVSFIRRVSGTVHCEGKEFRMR